MPRNIFDKSILIMRCQAIIRQYLPSFMLPFGISGPHCVNANDCILSLTLYVLNFSEETQTYIYVLSFLHIDMNLFYIVNIMGADVLATQGARVSAAMIFTKFNRINSVPAC